MKSLAFTKMEGLGNDFIVVDDLGLQPATQSPLTSDYAIKICDRRFGVGADQILWLRKPQDSTCSARMEILNADGSTAEMCGNGIRAVALYIQRRGPEGMRSKSEYRIETLAGVKTVSIQGDLVNVDMGEPFLGNGFVTQGELIEIESSLQLRFYEVNVGNPHAVFFVENVEQLRIEKLGPLVEKHSRFPQRTNVEFVEIIDSHTIRVRVWERGAGITLACGTGACASAVASLASGKVQSPVDVYLPGGKLKISWAGLSSSEYSGVMMEGPAREVFQGVYTPDMSG